MNDTKKLNNIINNLNNLDKNTDYNKHKNTNDSVDSDSEISYRQNNNN